jgi:transcriptional regulator with XRE-family HTH domain
MKRLLIYIYLFGIIFLKLKNIMARRILFMNINIGENIRNLRKKKNITQEELAESLGISFQSISKWERGEGFPDITMLPDLADFFNTSVDELLGADRISGGYLNDAYKQAHEYETDAQYDKAAELLRDTLKKAPHHYDIMSKLARVLLLADSDSEEGKMLSKKAIELCERHLCSSASEKSRATARAALCFLYDNTGDRQKAKELASKLPHMWESREILYAELLEGQEYIDYLKKSVYLALSLIDMKIESAGGTRINIVDMLTIGCPGDYFDHEHKNKIIKKIADFLD